MRHKHIVRSLAVLAVICAGLLLATDKAIAHCDTMDGPVVKAAQRALAKRNVNLVLLWVQKKDEAEIKQRFRQTLAVRGLNRTARELADNYFFETIVRLHRTGEGESYTGLKPSGTDLGPVIPVADKAFQDGSAEALLKLFPVPARRDIEIRFAEAVNKKRFDENNVEAGRQYVNAYITFMHHVEHLYEGTHKGEETGTAREELRPKP
ncbi:MAG: DUF6448 family protein [Pyrinomonadaceae bacterium]